MSPELFSSLLISSHLILAYLSFSDFHSSSHLFSALRSSCKLIFCVLISSLLFSHLLSSPHIYSADLSSCQLVSPHLSSSQRTLKSSQLCSSPRPAPKNGSRRQSKRPLHFPQRRFDTEKLFHTASFSTEKLVHREAFTQSKL